MQYILNGRRMTTHEEMHDHLAARLSLAPYYGRNLDALYDLLSERDGGAITLEHADVIPEELKTPLLRMLSDLDGWSVTVLPGSVPDKLKAVFFDMDGVMVNSEPRHIRACDGIVRRVSGGAHCAAEVHTVGISTEELYRRALAYCGVEGDPKALKQEHFDTTLRFIREEIPEPDERLKPLLNALREKGLKLAVCSSSPKDFVESILSLYGLDSGYFEFVLTGSDVDTLKPDPGIYLKACERMGVQSFEAAAIEDSRIGIAAATAAGLYTIGFTNPDDGIQDLSHADVTVEGFDGVEAALDLA